MIVLYSKVLRQSDPPHQLLPPIPLPPPARDCFGLFCKNLDHLVNGKITIGIGSLQ